MELYGKIPPQAIDIEEAVLGALMLEKEAIYKVNAILMPESFYKESHSKIYDAVISLNKSDKPIDLLTVTDELRKRNQLEEIGGVAFISLLTLNVGSAAHIDYHALIIQQKYIQREIIRMTSEVQTLAFDDAADAYDLINTLEKELNRINDSIASNSKSDNISELVNRSVEAFDVRYQNKMQGKSNGIKTPLVDLTKLLHGWQPGDLVILAARPSMGKTAFSLAIAKTAGKEINVLYFSLEMTGIKLADRFVIGETGIDADRYLEGNLYDYEIELLEKKRYGLDRLKITINDEPNLNVLQIKSIARNERRRGKCDLIIVDYLGLITPASSNKNYNLNNEIGEISRELKGIAKELNVPLIALSQLNRNCEARADKKPHLADLRDSGSIEQDADVVMFLFRPAQYPDTYEVTDDNRNKVMLMIEKHRNGKTGIVEFKHNDSLTEFYDIDVKNDNPTLETKYHDANPF